MNDGKRGAAARGSTVLVCAVALLTVLLPAVAHADCGSWNAPHKYGQQRATTLDRLDRRGVQILAVQQWTDRDHRRLLPDHWRAWRPEKARSASLLWNNRTHRLIRAGAYQLSSPAAPAPRFIVWAVLQDRRTHQRIRAGSAHLVAWPYRTAARAAEHAHQTRRLATWLQAGPRRWVGTDLNSRPRHPRVAPLRAVAHHSRPVLATYSTAPIDQLWSRRRMAADARTWHTSASDHRPITHSCTAAP